MNYYLLPVGYSPPFGAGGPSDPVALAGAGGLKEFKYLKKR